METYVGCFDDGLTQQSLAHIDCKFSESVLCDVCRVGLNVIGTGAEKPPLSCQFQPISAQGDGSSAAETGFGSMKDRKQKTNPRAIARRILTVYSPSFLILGKTTLTSALSTTST